MYGGSLPVFTLFDFGRSAKRNEGWNLAARKLGLQMGSEQPGTVGMYGRIEGLRVDVTLAKIQSAIGQKWMPTYSVALPSGLPAFHIERKRSTRRQPRSAHPTGITAFDRDLLLFADRPDPALGFVTGERVPVILRLFRRYDQVSITNRRITVASQIYEVEATTLIETTRALVRASRQLTRPNTAPPDDR